MPDVRLLPRIGDHAVFRDSTRLKPMESLAQHLAEAAVLAPIDLAR